MLLPQPLNKYQHKVIQIAQDNDVSYVALYGSYSRGEQTKDSDLDLLVSFDKKKGLLDLISIEQKLSELLNIKVDVVTKEGLNKHIKPYIQDDLKIIYEKKSKPLH